MFARREGQNFAIQGQKEKAIASFEQAVLANPSNASAHLALGDLYYGQLEFIDAAYHYHRYVQLMERRGQRPDISAGDNLRNCEMQMAIKFSRELSRQQNDLEIENLRRQITEKEGTIQQLRSELLQRSPTNQVAIAAAGGGTPSRPSASDQNPSSRTGTPQAPAPTEPVVSGGSTNRPTTLMSRRCARLRTHCSNLPAVCWSSATTVGSSTALLRMFSHLKATVRCVGLKATSANTNRGDAKNLALLPIHRIALSTSPSLARTP
jgi:hypothetical protein